jgi:hypothetical protein
MTHRLTIFVALLLLARVSMGEEVVTRVEAWCGGDFVQIFWDTSDDTANGYVVEYSSNGAVWTSMVRSDPSRRSCTHFDPAPGQAYYRVALIRDDGTTGQWSVSAKTKIPHRRVGTATWNKNNIITDKQLTARTTMNLADIQAFLVSQGGALASYKVAEKTAALLIHEACQEYAVNPRVVLTTLQKEQGLVTAVSPSQDRFDLAMGWNEFVDSTMNFADQVWNGTRQWRLYYDRLSSGEHWYVDKDTISWTINERHHVTDGYVTPVNVATAGLYIYTPFIGGETGIGGNFLFWKLWTESFGFGHDDAPVPLALLGPGVPTSPGTVLRTVTPTLAWQKMTGAAFYTLTIETQDGAVALSDPWVFAVDSVYSRIPADKLTPGTTYRWRLEAFDSIATPLGTSEWLYFTIDPTTSIAKTLPLRFGIGYSYPNPFNAVTTIPIHIVEAGSITLTLYSVTGAEVEVLANATLSAGSHRFTWDASRHGSGVYIARLAFKNQSATRRLILVR